MKKKVGSSFLALGIVFLIIGFIQQEMILFFESGMFHLGLMFTLGGLAAVVLDKRR